MIVVIETAHREATGFANNCFLFSLSNLDTITISLIYYRDVRHGMLMC